jgi:hypothetical protein
LPKRILIIEVDHDFGSVPPWGVHFDNVVVILE